MPVDHASNSSWEGEPSDLPVAIGDVLDGKYKIVRVLGKGGMGVVMAAVHVQLGHRIALKFLSRAGARNGETLARFALEAKAAALMRSEHATRILDIGRLPSSEPYMVLEMLEGSDLGALVTRRGPLPITDAVTYVLEACEAIAEAHSLGIVHRDLKPDNLFLATRPDGTQIIKVLDFGISKFSSNLDDRLGPVPALTTTSAVIGSPIYMSPEQLRSTRDVDHRTDIWSIGVALYELISGQPPFPWRTMAELSAAILKDTPVLLSTRVRAVSPELDQVIMRCLEKDPKDRYDNIAEFAWALVPFGGPLAVQSAERASELLARASSLPKKRTGSGLEERQARETQSAQTSEPAVKFVALPLGGSRRVGATATTEEFQLSRYSLTSPILRGLPVAAIFCALLFLMAASSGHLRVWLGKSAHVAEARRGIAYAVTNTLAANTSAPGTTTAPSSNAAPSSSTPNTVLQEKPNSAPSVQRNTHQNPRSNVSSSVPRHSRRNPFADRE